MDASSDAQNAQYMADDPNREAKERFLISLSSCANVTSACQQTGIPRRTVYLWRDVDPDFASAWLVANEYGTDALEDEATRRGRDGVSRPVYQGGRHVGDVQEYSDTLLMFMLKARRPNKFKDRGIVEVTGKDGQPIQHRHTHHLTVEQFRALPADERIRALRAEMASPSPN